MDCKALTLNLKKQEVITPIYPNRLVRWSISPTPTVIDQLELPYVFNIIPDIILLPDNRFVVGPAEMMLTPCLYLREWSNWENFERIEISPEIPQSLAEGNTSSSEMTLSRLLLTPCSRYLILSEGWEDMHLFSPEKKQWHRWARQWDDYAMNVAFDPQMTLMVVSESCTDVYPLLFRIDNIQSGELTCLEQFGSDITCHRGALSFSPDGTLLIYTRYSCENHTQKQIDLVAYQIDRTACQQAMDIDDEAADTNPELLSKIWHTSLPLSHEHDRLNPWQSAAIWIDNEWIIFAVGTCIAKVHTANGRVESTVNVGEIINAIAPLPNSNQVIAATKNGIKIQQIYPQKM